MAENSFIAHGGPILAAIAACAVCAFLVFFERLIVLHRSRIRYGDFLAGFFNILSKGKVREALAICDETPGPVARIAHSAVMQRSASADALRDVLANVGKAEVARMERRLQILSAIVHAAPMLGLLGAVLGALDSVKAIRCGLPLVQGSDLAAGLSSALECTAAGLAVSILAYFMFAIVTVRIDRIILDMEQASSDIWAFITSGCTIKEHPAPEKEIAK